jgi:hypothetical protein
MPRIRANSSTNIIASSDFVLRTNIGANSSTNIIASSDFDIANLGASRKQRDVL